MAGTVTETVAVIKPVPETVTVCAPAETPTREKLPEASVKVVMPLSRVTVTPEARRPKLSVTVPEREPGMGVAVTVGVMDEVRVNVTVSVAVAEALAVAVPVGVAVGVAVDVCVAVSLAVRVAVAVAELVAVRVSVAEGV